MAESTQRVVSDGTLVSLGLSIDFIKQADISVFFNGVPASPGTWSWTGPNTIGFTPAVADGVEVLLRRGTERGEVINVFQDGAAFTNDTIDTNFKQTLFLTQEALEGAALTDAFTDVDFHGFQVKNLGLATAAGDALPFGQYQADINGAFANRVAAEAAAASATASAASAAGAADAAVGGLVAALGTSTGAAAIGFGSTSVAAELTRIGSLGTPDVVPARPAYIEQNITGFFGRGMLTAEVRDVVTEQAITITVAAGDTLLPITNDTSFVIGGSVTVKHDNGLYGTYSITSKTGNTLGILPPMRHTCTVPLARVERTWFNRAHPGKFYMRELAQRIAYSTEYEAAMPSGGRILFTNVASNPNTLEDTLVSVGGTAVNYFPYSHIGASGSTTTPPRFMLGRAAFVDTIDAAGDGVETQVFATQDVADAVVKVAMHSAGGNHTYAIQAVNDAGAVIAELVVPTLPLTRIYTLAVSLRGTSSVKVRVVVKTYGSAGAALAVSQIDCFEAPTSQARVIPNGSSKIVCLGDSWVGGDLGNTPQREPITQQLQLELPNATIINAGVGGNKIWEMLARFDADVAVHKPDFVVVNTGTNECYNPSSGTPAIAISDFLRDYNVLLSKIASIGARAIILGTPALAQSDEEVPGFAEWLLNDRAQDLSRYFFEWQSLKPVVSAGSNANGRFVRYADGTLQCFHTMNVSTTAANTLASASWSYPVSSTITPNVQVTCSGYDTGQVVAVGTSGANGNNTGIRMLTSVGGVTLPVSLVMFGRWK